MASEFRKKLQNLFRRRSEDPEHSLALDSEDITIGVDTAKELSRENPLVNRLLRLKELTDIVAKQRVEEYAVESIWIAIKDLLRPSNPLETRSIVLAFLEALIRGQYGELGLLRHHFFRVVAMHNIEEDFAQRLGILTELTGQGRNVQSFEQDIGPLLLNWMPVMANHEKLSAFLKLTVNVIHFNASYLEESVISGLVQYTCVICDRFESISDVVELCLELVDSVLCYSCLPTSALHQTITTLCHTVVGETFSHVSWQLMSRLLGTHLGHRGIYTLCEILRDNASDPCLLQGAIFFLGESLWGGQRRVSSLKHSFPSVLPSIRKALDLGHPSVFYNALLSMERLIEKEGQRLDYVTWDLVLSILESISVFVESEKSLVNGSRVARKLHHIFSSVEGLCESGKFLGEAKRFFSLAERFTCKRPELCALTLVSFRARAIDPSASDWIQSLESVLIRYYVNDARTNVRLKALTVLEAVLSSIRHTFEDLLIESVVLPLFHSSTPSIEEDGDVDVRQAVVQLHLDLAFGCTNPHFFSLVVVIERVVKRTMESETQIGKDVETAMIGLVELFKYKLLHIPPHHSYCLFRILVNHVQLQYKRQDTSSRASKIRQQIFECFLRLRANPLRQLGLLCSNNTTVDYSPFVTCDESEDDVLNKRRSSRPLPIGKAACFAAMPHQEPICYVNAFDSLLMCLQQERDGDVLAVVGKFLSAALRNKTLMLACDVDLDTLCQLLCKVISTLVKDGDSKDCLEDFYKTLFTLTSYFGDLKRKQELLECLERGLSGRCSRSCLLSIKICLLEMNSESPIKRFLPSILSSMAKLSATVNLSGPLLECLQVLSWSELEPLHAGCREKDYHSIFSMLIPYTDSTKFSSLIVTLAFHVTFSWFVRIPLQFRKSVNQFVSKRLDSLHVLASESQGGSGSGSPLVSPRIIKRQKSPNFSDYAMKSVDEESKKQLTASASLRDELKEVCADLMAHYTFSNVHTHPSRSNTVRWMTDGGLTKSWLVGRSVVTITTALERKDQLASSSRTGTLASLHSIDSLDRASPFDSAARRGDIGVGRGWADVLVRRPTANISWTMRVENKGEPVRASVASVPLFGGGVAGSDTPLSLSSDHGGSVTSFALRRIQAIRGGGGGMKKGGGGGGGSAGISPYSSSLSSPVRPAPRWPTLPVNSPFTGDGRRISRDEILTETASADEEEKSEKSEEEEEEEEEEKEADVCRTTAEPIPSSASTLKGDFNFETPQLGESPLERSLINMQEHKDVATRSLSPLLRNKSCPELHLFLNDPSRAISARFSRQSSREAEDVLLSPTSPRSPLETFFESKEPESSLTLTATPSASLLATSAKDSTSISQRDSSALDPSFVFMQLYGQIFGFLGDANSPVLLPQEEGMERAIKVLDHLPAFSTHKIGLIYVGNGQRTENEVLANSWGSSRYCQFVNGIGSLVRLSDCQEPEVCLGGLHRTGEDGDFTCLWKDGVTQVVFHVATLMGQQTSSMTSKKLHIGNNFVTIVYNDSGEIYPPDVIKSRLNSVDIIITPLDMNSNEVAIRFREGSAVVGIADLGPYVISDNRLPVLARQLALVSDLACLTYREQVYGDVQGSNWVERLRKIKQLYGKVGYSSKAQASYIAFT